jgi:hypothetical protein
VIRWTSNSIGGNVKIELSRNAGVSWETLLTSTANDGRERWVVRGPVTTRALIRVRSVNNAALQDTSDALFTIRNRRLPHERDDDGDDHDDADD